eukprot:SAG11_NODE_17588_length_514_cov_0.867470_1_plen_43_part_10
MSMTRDAGFCACSKVAKALVGGSTIALQAQVAQIIPVPLCTDP